MIEFERQNDYDHGRKAGIKLATKGQIHGKNWTYIVLYVCIKKVFEVR